MGTVADLLQQLRAFWVARRAEVDERWKRTLPLADYVVDRWEKARLLGFGEGTSIYDSSLVLGDVKVGNHTWIGPFTILDGQGQLKIGSHCDISAGVQIYTHNTVERTLRGGTAPIHRAPTCIGSYCYIGPNTVVGMGVTIGDHCVVGANSLVLDNIPPRSKAWGTPCRVVGAVAPEETGRNPQHHSVADNEHAG
jgi:acetyltransferase-like isoleucine patch superfamily enzyme